MNFHVIGPGRDAVVPAGRVPALIAYVGVQACPTANSGAMPVSADDVLGTDRAARNMNQIAI
jgi:hypothetical protein